MIDKTTKVLLSLILIVLLALLLRPVISPAVAQSSTPHLPTSSNVAIVEDSFGMYVVANGYLSWWYAQPDLKGHGKLILRDAKPLPPVH